MNKSKRSFKMSRLHQNGTYSSCTITEIQRTLWYQSGFQLHVNPPNLGSQTLRIQRGATPFTFRWSNGKSHAGPRNWYSPLPKAVLPCFRCQIDHQITTDLFTMPMPQNPSINDFKQHKVGLPTDHQTFKL